MKMSLYSLQISISVSIWKIMDVTLRKRIQHKCTDMSKPNIKIENKSPYHRVQMRIRSTLGFDLPVLKT